MHRFQMSVVACVSIVLLIVSGCQPKQPNKVVDGAAKVTTDQTGSAFVESKEFDQVIEIRVEDEEGNPLPDIELYYAEDDGIIGIHAKDPSEHYLDSFLLGDPKSLAALGSDSSELARSLKGNLDTLQQELAIGATIILVMAVVGTVTGAYAYAQGLEEISRITMSFDPVFIENNVRVFCWTLEDFASYIQAESTRDSGFISMATAPFGLYAASGSVTTLAALKAVGKNVAQGKLLDLAFGLADWADEKQAQALTAESVFPVQVIGGIRNVVPFTYGTNIPLFVPPFIAFRSPEDGADISRTPYKLSVDACSVHGIEEVGLYVRSADADHYEEITTFIERPYEHSWEVDRMGRIFMRARAIDGLGCEGRTIFDCTGHALVDVTVGMDCLADCTDRECGDNGCGGVCGSCSGSDVCEDGVCVPECDPQTFVNECRGNILVRCQTGRLTETNCENLSKVCGWYEDVGIYFCIDCQPNCTGRECGDDGCGGECPPGCEAGEHCNAQGQCIDAGVVCPDDADCTGRECGPDPVCGEECLPGCGQGEACEDGQCVPTGAVCPDDADCTGRECGPDPVCGVECPPGCGAGESCNSSGQCIVAGCGDDCGEMVTVPAGPYWMGCNEAVDTECYSDELPYHEVNVPAFEIDKYQVTMAMYEDCVGAGGCTAPGTGSWGYCNADHAGRDDHPVNCITWYQAGEYCAWAGKRLCSEAEWEKAARGTDGRKYPWGNEQVTCEYAVFSSGGLGCGEDSTWPVGSKPLGASPYGALDMVGNVWEWVEDDYHVNYNGAPTDGSAWVDSPRASARVGRGGGFGHSARLVRASYRYFYDPGYVSYYGGARCCR